MTVVNNGDGTYTLRTEQTLDEITSIESLEKIKADMEAQIIELTSAIENTKKLIELCKNS